MLREIFCENYDNFKADYDKFDEAKKASFKAVLGEEFAEAFETSAQLCDMTINTMDETECNNIFGGIDDW